MNEDRERWIASRKWPLFWDTRVRGPCWVEAEGESGTGADDAVFAPAVGTRAGVVVGKVIPGISTFAIVLADRAPLPLTEIGPPLLPRWTGFTRIVQASLLVGFGIIDERLPARLHWFLLPAFPELGSWLPSKFTPPASIP
jgi:hypothetical protein